MLVKRYEPSRDPYFRGLARERIVIGDLFEYDAYVVPIKTRGQYYGSISKAVAERGVRFPELALGCAEYVAVAPGRAMIFVALWNDNNAYTPAHIYACTRACIKQASLHALTRLAMPLLGGNEREKFIGAMEQAVDDAMDETDEIDAPMPDIVFVTDLELL